MAARLSGSGIRARKAQHVQTDTRIPPLSLSHLAGSQPTLDTPEEVLTLGSHSADAQGTLTAQFQLPTLSVHVLAQADIRQLTASQIIILEACKFQLKE